MLAGTLDGNSVGKKGVVAGTSVDRVIAGVVGEELSTLTGIHWRGTTFVPRNFSTRHVVELTPSHLAQAQFRYTCGSALKVVSV